VEQGGKAIRREARLIQDCFGRVGSRRGSGFE
jgi:hypothetical protein